MIGSLKIGIRELRTSAAELDTGKLRTERDLSIKYVLLGVSIVILLITFIPGIIGNNTFVLMRFFSALAIAIFAFCFVTVSSRIVGMIGVSSNPTSGMAIVTLLGTGLIFQLLGWTDLTGKITALTIGTIVCISASIAGDISQDLKAGHTPEVGIGAEWQLSESLAVRLGLDEGNITAGAGFRKQGVAVDYAYLAHPELADVNRLSVSVRF